MDPTNDNSSNRFHSIDLDSGKVDLAELHAQVLRRNGRLELRRLGESCVLITKSELDSLEHALEILSNTDMVRALRDQIALAAQLAASSSSINVAPEVSSRINSLNLP